jgi:ATP-dependent RNA/DNA helicase IGHMBP2
MPTQRSETEHINELYQLKGLLKIEKQADYEYFKTLILNKPLEIRRAEGFTWYPVVVTQSGYTYGDRAYVVVERGGDVGVPHQFRSGNVVNLFTQQSDVYQAAYSGTVHYINKNTMRIVLNTKDLPDWLSGGSIGADMLFDEKTYLEMEKALEKVIHAKRNRLAELRDILLGHQLPSPYSVNPMSLDLPNLNPSQNAAIRDILANKDVAIIHGPPGTGKTTTLVQAIKRLCAVENTVLVTAPSNTATDLLTEKLALEGLKVVRLGNISRVDESVVRHTLESQLATHPESKNIKKVKIKAAELRRNARAFKRRFDHDARTKRERMLSEAKDLAAWANDLEQRLIDQLLDGADVITCTPVGAAHSILDNRTFRTVVIDEAAQALEPATWIPILKASKIVLAGDPFQLPPTVKSNEARQGGLGVTLLEKALIRLPDTNLLNVQYRMNEVIMNFSNAWFYQGVLKAAPSVAHRELPNFQDEKPVVFIDTIGCSFDEQQHPENLSKFNPEEFCVLREHLYQLMELFPYEKPQIGIISPYREQVLLMEKEISEDPLLKDLPITVQTIDGFQGQERDVIYISLVRSNEHAEIGFLADYRRMNVAMTRAKMKLVVVGDSGTIGKNRFYQHFLDYCELKASYRTAWEFMKP